MDVLVKRFHLNDRPIVFHLQTQKLELLYIAISQTPTVSSFDRIQMILWKKRNLKFSNVFKRRNNNSKLMRRRGKGLLCHYMTRIVTCQILIMKLSQV